MAIMMRADFDILVEGPEFTLEARIIYALVMRLGGTVTLSAEEMAVTSDTGGFIVDGGEAGCMVTAGLAPK
jgi:hypothetical protein